MAATAKAENLILSSDVTFTNDLHVHDCRMELCKCGHTGKPLEHFVKEPRFMIVKPRLV